MNGWDEPTQVPYLADFECPDCGEIGSHKPGCPLGEEAAVKDTPVCKIDGCTNPPVSQFGRYGGLCAEHRPVNGKQAAAGSSAGLPPSARANQENQEIQDAGVWLPDGELVKAARDVERARHDLDTATARLLMLLDQAGA